MLQGIHLPHAWRAPFPEYGNSFTSSSKLPVSTAPVPRIRPRVHTVRSRLKNLDMKMLKNQRCTYDVYCVRRKSIACKDPPFGFKESPQICIKYMSNPAEEQRGFPT